MTTRTPATTHEATTARRRIRTEELGAMGAAVADLRTIRPAVYWLDLGASLVVGWGALALAVGGPNQDVGWSVPGTWLLLVIAGLALYRSVSFIHEVSHFGNRVELAGWVWAYRLGVGVPMLLPPFLYELHTEHHAPATYGTDADGEYFAPGQSIAAQLAMPAVFAVVGLVGLALRFGIVAPLSWLSPRLAEFKWRKLSSLSVRQGYSSPSDGDGSFLRRHWQLEEALACGWVWLLVFGVGTSRIEPGTIGALMVAGGIGALVNGLRVVGAHRYGATTRQTRLGQYFDAVDYAQRSRLGALWAPVGLRFHAVHHLFPRLPYHSLGEARKRLEATWDCDLITERSLIAVVARRVQGLDSRAGMQRFTTDVKG